MLDKIKRADMLQRDIPLVHKCQGMLRKSFAYDKPPSEIHMHYRVKKKAEQNEVRIENFEEMVQMKRELQREGYKKHRGIRNKFGGVTTHGA